MDARLSTHSSFTSPTVTMTNFNDHPDGLRLKSAEEVRFSPSREDLVDPNLVDEKEKEKRLESQEEVVYVEFELGDPRNPVNYSAKRKWAITFHACYATAIAASTASGYNLGFKSMIRDLECTTFQATLGLSLYALGFGLFPLVTASFSEEFGRQPLYYASALGFFLMFVMIAEAKNIATVVVGRFLQGCFGSTWATMVGGTIADIWMPHERGLPMSIFALAAVGGTGLGPLTGGWIAMKPNLEWRWIEWIEMINCAVYIVMLPFIMKETRAPVLLTRLARKLRAEKNDKRYRARVEDTRASLKRLIWVSCTRPIHLLYTEPVVASFSVWICFAWGILFCLIESISGVFGELHHFNIGQTGTLFITLIIGSIFGFAGNFYQEKLYQKHFARKGPEARLYMACMASVLFPASMFVYAWCAYDRPGYWIAQAIAIIAFIWAVFAIYLCVFTYLADCYGPFASSALAGQSLCRNLAGFAFPLFTNQMFSNLGYRWANTIFACIAALMIPIPFVLLFFGPRIRSRSKFSRMVMEDIRK